VATRYIRPIHFCIGRFFIISNKQGYTKQLLVILKKGGKSYGLKYRFNK